MRRRGPNVRPPSVETKRSMRRSPEPLVVLHDHDDAIRRRRVDGDVGLLEDPGPGTVQPHRPRRGGGSGRRERDRGQCDRPPTPGQAPP